MSERFISSPEGNPAADIDSAKDRQLEIELKGRNLDKYDASTEQVDGTNERLSLSYFAIDKTLNIVDEYGYTTETVGTGEVAIEFIDELIVKEQVQSRRYINRLQEIKARIQND